jgi:ankyrin repeat protein
LIESGEVDINARQSSGYSLLMYALSCDHPKRFPDDIELLLAAKADVNVWSYTHNVSPLHLAVNHHNQHVPSILARMVETKADVNSKDYYAITPLMAAISCNAPLTVVQGLLEAKANPNSKNCYGESVLNRVRIDQNDVLSLLLQYGAHQSLTVQNWNGETVFSSLICQRDAVPLAGHEKEYMKVLEEAVERNGMPPLRIVQKQIENTAFDLLKD